MKSFKVSVVIPVFNATDTLNELIKVVSEEIKKFSSQKEIILVDDFSTDDSWKVIKTLSKKNIDKNLHILADVKKEVKKTKEFNNFLIKNKMSSTLIVSDKESEKNILKSARNIKNVKIINEDGANVYDLLKYKSVILTTRSNKKIENRILNEKN